MLRPPAYPDRMACMLCCEERNDAPAGIEQDEYGDWWTYCRKCDCWTAHTTPESTIGSVGIDP